MKKVRKRIEHNYKTAKKHRNKTGIVFIVISLFLFGAVGYKLYFTPKTTSNLSTQTATSTPRPYTEEMRQWDEKIRSRNAVQNAIATAPYVFKKIDLTQLNEQYHTNINNLSSSFLEPVECLVNSYNNEKPPTISIGPERISDENVLTYADKIYTHEFSDEYIYIDTDGSTKVANKGEKSKHNVTFNSVCRLNDVYFFSFNSYGEKTHIGGGGSALSRFAYSNGLENLVILEEHNSTNIELSETIDSSSNTTGSAYYGCRRIYAANNLEVLYGCGGGDGPASAGGLFLLNLSSKESVEKVFCEYSSVSKYKILCFNEHGKIYYQELN